MDPEQFFQIANVLPLPIWAIWMTAPRSPLARRLAHGTWPWAILAAIYAALMGFALSRLGFDPAAFGSLPSIMKLFQQPWVALAGWVHYLCFDLFVARWMMNDAPDAGYRLTPILFLTLMFGPMGLLLYLAFRDQLTAAEIHTR